MKTKKIIFGMTVLALAMVLLTSAGQKDVSPGASSSTEKPFVVRIGADSTAFSFQFRVAQRAGFFEKYNVEAEISTYSYGIDTLNAAILGETDSAEVADFAAASRFSENNKLRVVATITGGNANGSFLYTRNDSINSPQDLKGKRVGVSKGTVNEYQWARLFEKYGINEKDVSLVYLTSNAELLAAYFANEIDAFWVGASEVGKVEEIPGSRRLGNASLHGHLGYGFLLLHADVIAKNPDGVGRFLKALDEATAYIKEHPKETARIAYEELKIPEDSALIAVETQVYLLRLNKEDVDMIANVADWCYKNGIFRNNYNVYDFVDPRPLRNVLPDRVTVE
jgi:NitT/TauT family transport system substrate-binding protein